MTAAVMTALLAAAFVRSASADAACTDAYEDFSLTVGFHCKVVSTDSACGVSCVRGLRAVLTTCEGNNYTNSSNGTVQFDKAAFVSRWAIVMDEPCQAAATNLALEGGRCNAEDCEDATALLTAAGVFSCVADNASAAETCTAGCVAAMNAVYRRCDSNDESVKRAISGVRTFHSGACEDVLNQCVYGVGCGSTGTTTEPMSSGTTAEYPATTEISSDPETCPPPSTTQALESVSFSARAAALSLFTAVPVAMLFA